MSNNNITYRQVGDYFIPNLKLSAEEKETQIGIWGMRRKNYLLNNNRILFNIMLADGTLWKHLTEVDKNAEEMFSWLVTKMAETEVIAEELKATDQIVWVHRMMNIEVRAREVVLSKVIYV